LTVNRVPTAAFNASLTFIHAMAFKEE